MKTKLEIAKERKTRREQDRADIIALTEEIRAFNKVLNDKEDIDLTELKTQLTELPKLIAEPLNTSLGGFLDSFEPYLKLSTQKQKQPDLPGLLKNLKIEQPELDLKPIAKEIAKLKQKAVKQSQRPEDFIPYRRVVKMGNRFLFDDNMTSGGGGGAVDTSGLATTAKQDDIISAINSSGGTPSTNLAGDKDIANTATPEALASSTPCSYVLIQAKTSNTSNCFVGNASAQEVELEPGQAWSFAIDNLNKIYIRVGTNDDGVSYTGG